VSETGPVHVAELAMPIPGLERFEVTFESPLPSGHGFNDVVRAELWLPRDPIGVLIELPEWKESTLAGHRLMAMTLARKRIATMILPLPYQAGRAAPGVRSGAWTLSANLARTRQALFQGIADVARASLWLERAKGFAPGRQAVSGVSLGGHVAAVAYGAYPDRFAAGIFLLAGGNVHEAFLQSNGTTGRMRAALFAKGVTPAEALTLVGPMDPVRYADPRRAAGVLMVAATEDEVVPAANARALAAAYGGVPIHWIEGNHYAAARPDRFLKILRLMSEHCANVFGGR
jgi:dienelactone hydrolase